jgi:hypothetical protein
MQVQKLPYSIGANREESFSGEKKHSELKLRRRERGELDGGASA